jgi:hypothetical protein
VEENQVTEGVIRMKKMKTLTVNGTTYRVSPVVPASSVTLFANKWVGDGDVYSQVVAVPGVTARSKVDLQPTSEQLEEFHYKTLAFVAENASGVVTVFSVGDKPTGDHTIQITLTEVEGADKIRGNTVGTTMPQPDWNQTDPTKADYIRNKPSALGGPGLPKVTAADNGKTLRVVNGEWVVEEVDAITKEQGILLATILRNAVFSSNQIARFNALEDTFDSTPGIKVVYSGGIVTVGTPYSQLLGDVTVTRHYADGGSEVLEPDEFVIIDSYAVTGYNTVPVMDKRTGFTACFTVMAYDVMRKVTTLWLNDAENTVLSRITKEVSAGTPYSTTLTIPSSHELVDIKVTAGGEDITAEAVNGADISIWFVAADVQIVIAVRESSETFYFVTNRLTNAVNSNGAKTVKEQASYSATISANEGYDLQSVTVTMGGTDITASAYANGNINIASVTGDIVITASASNGKEEVIMTGLSAVYTGPVVSTETAAHDINGIVVTAHYSDGSTKTVERYAIHGTIQEGDNTLVIGLNGFSTTVIVPAINAPALCTIAKELDNATSNNSLPYVPLGSYYTTKITAKADYELQSVTVTMGGKDITATAYDAATGIVTIESVTNHVVITAITKAGYSGYRIINNLTYVTNSNAATAIEPGAQYECQLTPAAGYSLTRVVITMGGVEQINFTYERSPIYQSWKAAMVTGDIVITAVAERG